MEGRDSDPSSVRSGKSRKSSKSNKSRKKKRRKRSSDSSRSSNSSRRKSSKKKKRSKPIETPWYRNMKFYKKIVDPRRDVMKIPDPRNTKSLADLDVRREEEDQFEKIYIRQEDMPDVQSRSLRLKSLRIRLRRNLRNISRIKFKEDLENVLLIRAETYDDEEDGENEDKKDVKEEQKTGIEKAKQFVNLKYKDAVQFYDDYIDQVEKYRKWRIQPDFANDTWWYFSWMLLVFVIYFYYYFFQLYRLSFSTFSLKTGGYNPSNKGVGWEYIIDVTCDIFVLIHIYTHKFRGWMDYFFIFPLDLCFLLCSQLFGFNYVYLWHFFRINRVFFLVKRYNTMFHFFIRTFQGLTMKILKYYLLMLIIFNFCAVIWYLVLVADDIQNVIAFTPHDDLPYRSEFEIYLYAYHWCLATMTGYGGTTPASIRQIIFGILICAIGYALYISTIGSVFSLIENVDNKASRRKKNIDRIKNYISFLRIKGDLRDRIFKYYQFLYQTNRSWDERKILSELPHYLKVQILKDIHHEVVNAVPLFKNSSSSFIAEIIQNLKPRVALPNSTIIRQGAIGMEMYFLARGSVDVMVNGVKVHEFHSGSFFGEVALVMNQVRNASIVAQNVFCDLYVLLKKDFEKLGKIFKSEFEYIRDEAIKRNNETKKKKDTPVEEDEGTTPETPQEDED